MKRFKSLSLLSVAVLLVMVALLAGCAHAPAKDATATGNLRATANLTALDRYVAKPDPNYAFQVIHTFEGKSSVAYVLEMTSQQWRTAQEVDRPLWKHWVTIVVPEKVKSETALLVIGGGGNKGEPPKGGDVNLHRIANATGGIVAEVKMIPNQPLVFADDNGRKRSEDATIAYTWDKFMRTGDEEWPLRLPMTKAVVRAMDTIQTFCASKDGGKHKVESFVVAGASKRGWTTWTTSLVDKRVVACCPIVIDLLNIIPSFEHHWAVYGFWAPAIDDYTEMGIMDWMQMPEYKALMKIVEPYSYLDRLTLPKFIMNGSGDQFFLPDSTRFYIDDLKGPTYLRYVPNAGHGLNASAFTSVQSFYEGVITGSELPQYSWSFPDECAIRVETSGKPTSVKLWQATNPEARDFRIDKVGETYKSTDLKEEGKGVYVGRVQKPEKGWTAFLVELTFPGVSDAPHIFTSPIRITPDVTPFKYEAPANPPKGFISSK